MTVWTFEILTLDLIFPQTSHLVSVWYQFIEFGNSICFMSSTRSCFTVWKQHPAEASTLCARNNTCRNKHNSCPLRTSEFLTSEGIYVLDKDQKCQGKLCILNSINGGRGRLYLRKKNSKTLHEAAKINL